ncbi:hypothetical protein EVG20_g10319 [Dentipellis fragilis]|uniref:DUF6532 domain-containing protein n=1 Tax=Dentipellis fragilis TaxID=205917 RepID=A0A4Y9XT83_9AGAM|nr:hypothetical protein EVG20_g10319 [Dentipellis fragilis]
MLTATIAVVPESRSLALDEEKEAAESEARFIAREMEEADGSPVGPTLECESQRAAKKTKNSRSSYWEQSDEEGDGDNSAASEVDERMLDFSNISNSTPKLIVNPLCAKRKRKKTTADSAVAVSSQPSTPPRSSSPGPTFSFTPYEIPRADGALMGKQTPPSKSLSKKGSVHFCIKVSLDNGFPNDEESCNMARAAFVEACSEFKSPKRLLRFENDELYRNTMVDIVKRAAAQLHGELKTKAQGIIETMYGFGGLPAKDIKQLVEDLLHRGAFHFEDPKMHQGLFRNPIVLTLLTHQWVSRKNGEAAGIYAALFNPIPEELIALIVSTVECVINDYAGGSFQPKGNNFSADKYSVVYDRHLKSLSKYKKLKPAMFRKLQEDLWAGAWQHARHAIPTQTTDSDLDDSDFGDSEVEVPAATMAVE